MRIIEQVILDKNKIAFNYEELDNVAKLLKKKTIDISKMPTGKLIGVTKDVPVALNLNVFKNIPDGPNKEMAKNFVSNIEKVSSGGVINKNRGMESSMNTMDNQLRANGVDPKDEIIYPHRKRYRDAYSNFSNNDKKVSNQIANLHEHFETQGKEINRFESHNEPAIILKEQNALMALPEDSNKVKAMYADIRDREFGNLSHVTKIPKENMQNQRLSRHAIKHINNIYAKKLPDYNPWGI